MNFLLILLIGFIAEIVDGGLGMGFGVLSTSLLLNVGFGTALASAAVHIAEIFTTLAAGISHLKIGNVDKKIFRNLTFSGMLGGTLGAYVAVSFQHTEFIKPLIALILFIFGVVIFYRFAFRHVHQEHTIPRIRHLMLIGFPAAFIDALGGGGWGSITTSSLMIRNSHPQKTIGSVSLSEFFITITISLSFFALLPHIEWRAVLPLAIGGLITAPFAAYLTKKLPHRVLGISVGFLIIILSLRTLAKVFGFL